MIRKGLLGGSLKLLTEESINKVHQTVMRVIEEVGFEVNSEVALGLFKKVGAWVDVEKRLVRLPPNRVMEFIEMAPSEIKLCGLDEKNDIIRAKEDLIQLLRDKINSLENRIRIFNPDFSAVAEENVIQANKEAQGSLMKEKQWGAMDNLKQFEEHYAKEIDSSYRGKIPRFMPEDHTRFDH